METKNGQADIPQRKFLPRRFPGEKFMCNDQADEAVAKLRNMIDRMMEACERAEETIATAKEGFFYMDYAGIVCSATSLVEKAEMLADVADFTADTIIENCKS